WRTLGDANQERHIWIVDFDKDGRVVSRTGVSTGDVCKRFHHFTDTPDEQVDVAVIQRPHRYQVDVVGPADYCHARKSVFKQAGARVRTFPEKQSTKAVRESDGIDVAFGKFIDSYVGKYGTKADTLKKMASERLNSD